MVIHVLIENTVNSEAVCLRCEHGLSLHIQWEGKKILLDAGATEAFAENAAYMGIELSQIDFGVLSHGHYDHSGGFEAVFKANPKIKIYGQSSAAGSYFSGSGELHEIGIPEKVLKHSENFVWIAGSKTLSENIHLIAHTTPGLEVIGKKAKLYRKTECGREEQLLPDDFSHEQSLVFSTAKGLVIFNSCSHGGVGNIIREAKEACGGEKVYAYIGGFHMKGKRKGEEICAFSEAEVDELCEAIKKEGISYVYTGHCTGKPGFQKLKERLGDKVLPLTTGMTIQL